MKKISKYSAWLLAQVFKKVINDKLEDPDCTEAFRIRAGYEAWRAFHVLPYWWPKMFDNRHPEINMRVINLVEANLLLEPFGDLYREMLATHPEIIKKVKREYRAYMKMSEDIINSIVNEDWADYDLQ